MDDNKCKECNSQYSCNYMQHRFQVKECDIGKEIIINQVHLKELNAREVLLEVLNKNGRH